MSSSHVSRNFFAQGGSELVIGGTLTFLPGAKVEGLPLTENEASLHPAAGLPESNAATVAELRKNFNQLLAVLKESGLMSVEEAVQK